MKKLLFFGDSIMAGRGIIKDFSYVGKIEQAIRNLEPDRLTIHNLAIPGEPATHLLTRLNSECKSRLAPTENNSIIFLGSGINDSKLLPDEKEPTTSELRKFAKTFEAIIATAQKWSTQIIVLGLTQVNEKHAVQFGFQNNSINKYSEVIKEICEKHNITFVDLAHLFTAVHRDTIFLDDGIHLNEKGHELIFKALVPQIYNVLNNSYNVADYLSQMLMGFSPKQITKLEALLPASSLTNLNSKLLFGAKLSQKPDVIIGGPCLRKDIEGISLNTFHQVFIPLLFAKQYNVPCKIFLGIQEEVTLSPKKTQKFLKVAEGVSNLIANLGQKLNVQVTIANTVNEKIDLAINESVEKFNFHITPKQSTYLFSLFGHDRNKPLHSELRAQISSRVLACHHSEGIKHLFQYSSPMIVEDLEQLGCFQSASRVSHNKANFFGFLPLPTLDYSSVMFKGNQTQRLILGKTKAYYEKLYDQIPDEALSMYLELFRLYNLAICKNSAPIGKKYFAETLVAISALT